MIDNRKDMSCQEFSACMADLIAAGQDIFAHPHVRRCSLHRALLDDLEAIANAARQLLRDLDPPDTLWDGIQARLGFEPAPAISHSRPGLRVTFALKVIESSHPGAGPPYLDTVFQDEKLVPPTTIDAVKRLSERRGGDDR